MMKNVLLMCAVLMLGATGYAQEQNKDNDNTTRANQNTTRSNRIRPAIKNCPDGYVWNTESGSCVEKGKVTDTLKGHETTHVKQPITKKDAEKSKAVQDSVMNKKEGGMINGMISVDKSKLKKKSKGDN